MSSGKGEILARSGKSQGEHFTDNRSPVEDKNLPAAHCPRCDRAGFRPVIILPEPEDPRDVAIRTLIAIKDHDRNLTPGDQITLDGAIQVCRRSLFKDNDGRDP